GVSVRGHKTRANPLFGAGASFAVWRGLTVHLDWDHARATTQANEKLKADLFSLGVGWRF
ncbi:MAG: porin family protein, partial [Burkholderiaceae bacterium]|nr:porin family protein [Burkholderiaceae bacterium]